MGYLGEFEQLILFSIVELGGEAYGGAIRDSIERRTGRVVSSGAINTALGRMAERRLVTARVGAPTAGRAGRPRKYHAITPRAARELKKSFTTLQAMGGGLLPKLTRLAEGKP
jgi:PadR family transcriptional regulator PadR